MEMINRMMDNETEKIEVFGARVHNLKNVDVELPRNSLTVITGLSGSGKSSLAFDTIFAEGQRRYIETFSAYARNFLGNLERPDVDKITGLSPVISIEQKTTNKNPRSTVGTTTEIYDFLRLLYARAGDAVVLPDMTAHTMLFQNAVLEYSLDSLAHIVAEYIIHVGNLLHGHPYSIGRHGYRSALADSYNSSVHFPIVFSFDNLFLSRLAISLSMSFEIFCSVTCA